MRDNLVVGGMALAIVLCTAGIVAVVRTAPEPTPPEVTPVVLDSDPRFFEGRTVRLKTSGMEPTDDPRVWVYRKLAGQPPIVLIRLEHPHKELPGYVVGSCIGRHGTAVTVVNCRGLP